MDFNVREATLMDYTEVAQIHKQVHEMHMKVHPDRFKKVDVSISLDQYSTYLLKDDAAVFVAEIANKVVGFVIVEIEIREALQQKIGIVNNIGVLEVYLKFGIGRKLFEKCVEWVRKNGASDLALNVYEFNQDAIGFYEKMGMETLSRRMVMKI